jgi:hypothetical protein
VGWLRSAVPGMRACHFFCLSLGGGLSACAQVTSEDPPSRAAPAAAPASGRAASGGTTSASAAPLAPLANAAPLAPLPSGSAPAGAPAAAKGGAGPSPTPIPDAALNPAPPAATGPAGELLLSDDFEDGNDQGWIADTPDGDDRVGDWSVVAAEQGHVYAQRDDSFSDESWSVGGDVRWTDVSVETRFRFTAVSDLEDATVMLALRFRSKDDYYYLEYGGDGSLKIRKRFDGSDDEVSSEDLDRSATLGQWIQLRFVARGSALSAFVDGVPIGSGAMDTDLPSGGIALGVQENAAAEFDDVRVTRP